MNNTLTVAELKRRGMAAIEEGLQHGPIHIMKRNRATAVVLSEEEYQRLTGGRSAAAGMTAVQWLLSQTGTGTRDKVEIDTALAEERDW
ncbi:type II toxin-antitoxin system Phd/YefM family antitoxin [Burkholderia sp. BCC0419]|uniref:type II toxin-antitoxin system Phd/YefM family antitoxin n=1 Tax=Burkholderia sp. BCC0419 TaxID=486878 RepID=UPI00158F1C57|nr:type II toxin-antitoxin system Phd/YefM family antitoxin [Burkholderia sp. BCC0419]